MVCRLKHYDFAVFDCDGVILNSNSIKMQCFRCALGEAPKELIDQFIEYHQSFGGVSRYVKFKQFYTEIYVRKLT